MLVVVEELFMLLSILEEPEGQAVEVMEMEIQIQPQQPEQQIQVVVGVAHMAVEQKTAAPVS